MSARRRPKVFHEMDIGAGVNAWAISNRARKNPSKNYLATDFKFEKTDYKWVRGKGDVPRPFPKNLHFTVGAALTAINKARREGVTVKKIVIAMGVDMLLNPHYLGKIGKHASSILEQGGEIYFISTWEPKVFKGHVVPRFEKLGYTFKQLRANKDRQYEYSGKAMTATERYRFTLREYVFTLNKT
jgi:hypothetical protein